MQELNEQRAARGELPLQISVGVNTGACMAGNMGSAQRLNYTVLGDAVNMAARIEGLAAPGQVLITEHTFRHVEGSVEVRDAGLRELRGFAHPVRVYEAVSVTEVEAHSAPTHATFARGLALIPVLLALAAPASAQLLGELPTLERLHYTSPSGNFELGFSGRLDLEGYLPNHRPFWIIPDTDAFAAPRLRLFVDAFFGDHVIGSAEVRADRGEEPRAGPLELRVDQLFLRVAPHAAFAAQAGKFVSPFGGWIQRHHTRADPFIRPPLAYDHRTVLNAGHAPPDAASLLMWKHASDSWRPTGAPPIWGAPYQWGGMLLGQAGPVNWRAAIMNSAVSSEPEEWGLQRGFSDPSFVVNAGLAVLPSLRLEASYNHGPWMRNDATGVPTTSYGGNSYDQRLWGLEAVWRRGQTSVRGELLHDTWEVPNITYDPVDISWYVEGETVIYAGVSVAARYGTIHFSEVGWGGTDQKWDHDVSRIQLSAGYRLARNAGIRTEYGANAGTDNDARLFAVQLWWEF
jgi:hypothetical protein